MACQITVLDCNNPADALKISEFADLAAKQYATYKNFTNIFPWQMKCSPNHLHFVAHAVQNGETVICGWLVMFTMPNPLRGYIADISTRRIRDELYGGVGQRLNQAVVQWATENGLDFLELWPLNETVRNIYLKPEWGYVEFPEDRKHLYRVIYNPPTKDYMKRYAKREEEEEGIQGLLHTVQDLTEDNRVLRRLFRKARQYIREGNPYVEDFNLAVQYVLSLDDDEQEPALMEILTKFLDDNSMKGGTRRRRRRQCQRQRHRQRKHTRKH